jgi:YesN/AraC family two-component response regulator
MQPKPITVLLVDDEERIRRSARLLLDDDKEVRVVGEADNGRSAAEMACKLCPDVIVMDISMPIMNGLDAARKILKDCPTTRIIMTTAMGGEPYRRVSMSLGVAGFLEKSSLDAELLHIIHETARHGPH